ncbi:hypothetical protein BGX38DRAFT_1192115 [Terfezia claveryi]|nr:hypothetical protein BGX38DRAFT_1192115 [Terfezia claveryi]
MPSPSQPMRAHTIPAFLILSLLVEYQCYTVDYSESDLPRILLIPNKCPSIPPQHLMLPPVYIS